MDAVLYDRLALLKSTQAGIEGQQSFLFISYWRTNPSDAINSCAEMAGQLLIPGALAAFSAPMALRSIVSEASQFGMTTKWGLNMLGNKLKGLMPPPMFEAATTGGARIPVPFKVSVGSASLTGMPPVTGGSGGFAGPTILMMSAEGAGRSKNGDGRSHGTKKGTPRDDEWRSGNYTREEFIAAARQHHGNRRKMAKDLGVSPAAISYKISTTRDPAVIRYLGEKGVPGFSQPGMKRKLQAARRLNPTGRLATEIAQVLDEPGITIRAAAERLGYKNAHGLRDRIRSDPDLSGYRDMIDGRHDKTGAARSSTRVTGRLSAVDRQKPIGRLALLRDAVLRRAAQRTPKTQ